MANEYFINLIEQACDSDKRRENTLPAEMITVGYAEVLLADGTLDEGEEGVKG